MQHGCCTACHLQAALVVVACFSHVLPLIWTLNAARLAAPSLWVALAPMDVVLTAPVNKGGSPIVSYRVNGVPTTAGRANITVTGMGKALSLTQVKSLHWRSIGRGCCWTGFVQPCRNGSIGKGMAAAGAGGLLAFRCYPPELACSPSLQVLFQFGVGTYVPGEQYTFWAHAINGVGVGPVCAPYRYRAPPGGGWQLPRTATSPACLWGLRNTEQMNCRSVPTASIQRCVSHRPLPRCPGIPGILSITQTSSGAVEVVVTAPGHDFGSPITSYAVVVQPAAGSSVRVGGTLGRLVPGTNRVRGGTREQHCYVCSCSRMEWQWAIQALPAWTV